MIILQLNPMMGNYEELNPVACAETKEALKAFIDREKVDTYTDDGPNCFDGGDKKYTKHFRKGGPLEWFNGLDRPEERLFIDVGTADEWAERARQNYHKLLSPLVHA